MSIATSIPNSGDFALSIVVSGDHDRSKLALDLTTEIEGAPVQPNGTTVVQAWLEQVRDGDDAVVAVAGLRPYRDLLQLRRQLPAEASCLATRPFDLDRDAEQFIAVNNRAFSWHPEQSGYTLDRLQAAMDEPGFNAEGFRILEIDGALAGFCWTKIHAGERPAVGEIYVIAIDPAHHGKGLGGPMTLAGLEWLTEQGLSVAKLYVESDNQPATRTYERLGFALHSTNRAYTTAPS